MRKYTYMRCGANKILQILEIVIVIKTGDIVIPAAWGGCANKLLQSLRCG